MMGVGKMSKEIPNAVEKGLTFYPMPEFTDAEIAFGADVSSYFNRRDLPMVPREFKSAAMDLFYNGGKLPEFDKRVDREKAMRAVRALLSSFAPAHESKEATVGYAFWVWSSPEAIDAAERAK
jgi:hypothetical protein